MIYLYFFLFLKEKIWFEGDDFHTVYDCDTKGAKEAIG